MRQFTDTAERSWNIQIGIDSCRRVKEATNGRVDILANAEGKQHDVFLVLQNDIELLVQVLFVLCQQQAEKAGISETQFAEALDMTTVERATTAFTEAIIDFFPSRRRGLYHDGLAMARQIADEEANAAETKARTLMNSPEMADLMRAAVRGKPSSSMPAFSG